MKMASTEHNVSGNAPAGRKRFWKQADVVPEGQGFVVQLDGRSIRLPRKTPLCVTSRALADALAAEWQAAGQNADGRFSPADLPLTGIAGSMIERIPAEREGVLRSLLAYAGSDLLCYREPGKVSWRRPNVRNGTRGWSGCASNTGLSCTHHVVSCRLCSPKSLYRSSMMPWKS